MTERESKDTFNGLPLNLVNAIFCFSLCGRARVWLPLDTRLPDDKSFDKSIGIVQDIDKSKRLLVSFLLCASVNEMTSNVEKKHANKPADGLMLNDLCSIVAYLS